MNFEFCMQDPTDPETRYLYEAIIEAAADANTWRGMYAFATRGGVDQLIEDPVVNGLMRRGGDIDLVLGIDAITNRQTLERVQELEARHRTFRPRVFWNGTSGLFHPKISYFGYPDGRSKLIVGSGNLTPGGLMHNFEGYSIINADPGDALDMASLEGFLTRHAGDIRPIDTQALERAAFNVGRSVAGVPRPQTPAVARRPGTRGTRAGVAPAAAAAPLDRVLIARVPGAGGRWSQVHFNADIIAEYFRVTDFATQRVYLTRIDAGGIRGEEEVRPVVYSTANKNHKIEVSAAKHHDYPGGGPPILVFRERQVRSLDYMLLMPSDTGYPEIAALSDALPTIGRGFRRGITDTARLARAWPAIPLLATTASAPIEL